MRLKIPDPIVVVWAKVPNLPVEVSNDGQIRPIGKAEVTIKLTKKGYRSITIKDRGKAVSIPSNLRLTYRMIAYTFYGPLPDGQLTRHKNDVKSDDRLGNLAYGTLSENKRDSLRNGTGYVFGRKPKKKRY